jgi:hypothetical protein
MAQQFSGTVEILNTSSGLPTVILEGGDDESGGNLTLGGQGQSGEIILRDLSGRQHLFASGNESQPFLRLEDNLGVIKIELEGDTGNIRLGGRLLFDSGNTELNGATVRNILQVIQTVNEFAQRIQNLENREQALIQQVNSLSQQVTALAGRVISLEQKQVNPPPAASSKPQISVKSEGTGQSAIFVISGSGFSPSESILIRVADTQNAERSFQQSSDASGRLTLRVSIPCVSGLTLVFLATDRRSDASDITGLLYSNRFSTTCP